MQENDRQLGIALSSDEVKLVEKWLSLVLAEHATVAPLDERGRVDDGAIVFRAGQLSVLHRIRGMRSQLEGMSDGN